MNKYLINGSLIVSFFLAGSALAYGQAKTPQAGTDRMTPTVKERVDLKKAEIKQGTEMKKSEPSAMKKELNPRMDAAKKEMLDIKKVELKQNFEDRKIDLNMKREELKTKMEAAKEEFKVKRDGAKMELKEKLKVIKDEKKKERVERLDKRFEEINDRMVNHWQKALERMETLTEKIGSRIDKAEANGKDVAMVRTQIENVKKAIADAKTALEVQATKQYSITVVDEINLKSNVASVRLALNNDLKAIKEKIQVAHEAIVETLRVLRGIGGVDELKTVTTPTVVQ